MSSRTRRFVDTVSSRGRERGRHRANRLVRRYTLELFEGSAKSIDRSHYFTVQGTCTVSPAATTVVMTRRFLAHRTPERGADVGSRGSSAPPAAIWHTVKGLEELLKEGGSISRINR